LSLGIGIVVGGVFLALELYAASERGGLPPLVSFVIAGSILGASASVPLAVWRRSWRPLVYSCLAGCVLGALLEFAKNYYESPSGYWLRQGHPPDSAGPSTRQEH
jgi:hypothetical protein